MRPVLITCDALSSTQDTYAFMVFERAFRDFGVPRAIRSDKGLPFASPNLLYGLSRLSVWWLRTVQCAQNVDAVHPVLGVEEDAVHPLGGFVSQDRP